MDVIFSGIQPSGDLTLGNYLGALKNFIPFQDKAECFYCIVNQHAITVPQDPKLLHERTRNLAALYIAAGLDPKKATIFVQSEVPEHALLGWMMICSAYVGEMERMTQYKSKAQKQEKKNGFIPLGLLTYPPLMASASIWKSQETWQKDSTVNTVKSSSCRKCGLLKEAHVS